MRFNHVGAGVVVRVEDDLVERNIGYLPWVLGENLAGQIDAFVCECGLGYYPALDYFRARPEAVDPALIALTDEVAAFCGNYARQELRRRLSRTFAAVKVERIHCNAYAIPKVRPARANSPGDLARHYSPNTIKLDLVLQSLVVDGQADVEDTVVQRLSAAADGAFATFQILNSRFLDLR